MQLHEGQPALRGRSRVAGNSQSYCRRGGFTLIELLVAILIFIILTTLTVATINLNLGSERISAASRQMQAMFEGARARAFKLQRPVGVRFIMDPNFPGEVTGMLYVSAVENPGGGSYQTGRVRFLQLPGGAPAIQQLPAPGSIPWNELNVLQLLRAGVRVRIPAATGPWYTVSSQNFLSPDNTVMQLNEMPTDVSFGAIGETFENNSGTITNYELDLSTVMAPLQGEDAVQLPPGTVVDLRNCKVPRNWYINRWGVNVPVAAGSWVGGITPQGLRAYRADNDGVTGDAEPNWGSAVITGSAVNDNGIVWRSHPVPLLDVIFTPQGSLLGSVAAEGLLHFVLAETRDTRIPLDDGTVGLPPLERRGEQRVITVFGTSGAVNVSPLNLNPGESLFRFAIEGATSK